MRTKHKPKLLVQVFATSLLTLRTCKGAENEASDSCNETNKHVCNESSASTTMVINVDSVGDMVSHDYERHRLTRSATKINNPNGLHPNIQLMQDIIY